MWGVRLGGLKCNIHKNNNGGFTFLDVCVYLSKGGHLWFLLGHNITIILMRDIVSSQNINKFDIIYECPGVKGFISRFGAEKI